MRCYDKRPKEKQFDFEKNENAADGAISGPSAQRVLSNRTEH